MAKGSKISCIAGHLTGHLLYPAISVGHLTNKATLSSQVQLESEGVGKDAQKRKTMSLQSLSSGYFRILQGNAWGTHNESYALFRIAPYMGQTVGN